MMDSLYCWFFAGKHTWIKFWVGDVLYQRCAVCRKREIAEPTKLDLMEKEFCDSLAEGVSVGLFQLEVALQPHVGNVHEKT